MKPNSSFMMALIDFLAECQEFDERFSISTICNMDENDRMTMLKDKKISLLNLDKSSEDILFAIATKINQFDGYFQNMMGIPLEKEGT